ncbi:gamma carbonic anhydrase family protein [Allorhizocola rhizosphaerae]|uniref:gamma carbonic anhydrase family protein n=1 Tax=Allorhizocola rhizosphaerae TaxID=1872709 RepID=UPI000E3CF20A|nr:gamma carbonic anhydrase family protein [Allorhizocola rhizosphaerae]
MLFTHAGKSPQIDPTAWVAPDATVCGDVVIGPDARVMHGARVIGEAGGSIRIGARTIVMENAVIRGSARHACAIGDHCIIGPNAHVTGATLDDQVFIATGAAVFHGARLGKGSEVRVHATVHLRTVLASGTTVPIGWVAVGEPAVLLPPDKHEQIWTVQEPLNFPGFVYGVERGTPDAMVEITSRLAEALGAHATDQRSEA